MNQKIYRLLRYIYYEMLCVLNFYFYKQENKVFFEDLNNVRDNHYILFNFMIDNRYFEKYKIIYFTKNKNFMKEKYKNVIIVNSTFIATLHYLTSKYIFFAYGINRFQCKPTKKQKVINLWHGMPAKKFGYMLNDDAIYPEQKCYTHLIISSEFFREYMKMGMKCNDNQIVVLGQPRNDLLFSECANEKLQEVIRHKYEKIVCYLPTFRNSEKLNINYHTAEFPLLNKDNIDNLDKFLGESNMCMVVKLHHAQKNYSLFAGKYNNIIFLNNEDLKYYNIALYELLGVSNALITDYSSVFVDYLLINKPMAFVFEDIDKYDSERGMLFNNNLDLMPGKKIYNLDDMFLFLSDIKNEKDLYKTQREKVNKIFNYYNDNNNCCRLLEYFGIR